MDSASTLPQNISPETDTLGPPFLSLFIILMRMMAILSAVVTGVFAFIFVLLLGGSIIGESLFNLTGENTATTQHPLFIFLAIFAVFLSGLAANLSGLWVWAYTDRDRYPRTFTTMVQVFSNNLALLIFSVPLYFISNGIHIVAVGGVAFVHLILSVISSFIILESLANPSYILVVLYGVGLGLIFALSVCAWMFYLLPGVLVFVALPIVWIFCGTGVVLFQYLYGVLYKVWGINFLSTEIRYGEEYGLHEETPKEEEAAEGKEKTIWIEKKK